MPKTTVVIPNYNGIKYIEDCLAFLKRSRTYQPEYEGRELLAPRHDFDTIVVDNGSTDGSLELVRREFPHVKIIAFSENTGFCKAVNEGIRQAETEYVLLLNNDTKTDPFFVSRMEQALEQKNGYFSIGAKMLSMKTPELVDDAGDLYCALGWAFAIGKDKKSCQYEKDYDVFAACAGAAIYRREIFEQIGLFDENHFAYLEDIDIGYRARIYGYKNGFCHDAVVYHAGSASTGSRYNRLKTRLACRNSIYLIYKNMPLLQILLNLPFLAAGYLIKTVFFLSKGLGIAYIRGMFQGFRLCFSKKGKRHKVPFQKENLKNYIKLQFMLWWNMVRRLTGFGI